VVRGRGRPLGRLGPTARRGAGSADGRRGSAPTLTPTLLTPAGHAGSKWGTSGTSSALPPSLRATSTIRIELLELVEPDTPALELAARGR